MVDGGPNLEDELHELDGFAPTTHSGIYGSLSGLQPVIWAGYGFKERMKALKTTDGMQMAWNERSITQGDLYTAAASSLNT